MTAAPGPFLRPAHPQRRRRRSLFARVAARVFRLLPALIVPAALWVWLDGTTFALAAIETEGSPRVAPEWIERALAPELGRNLLSLPLDRVRERLEKHPWLGRVEVKKELPDRLRVAVEERVAAAVLETEEGLFYVDADGQRIAWLEPGDGVGSLLRIAAGTTVAGVSPALATGEASSVRRALDVERALQAAEEGPAWSVPLLWVEVVGDDDFRLYLGDVPFSILARSEGIARRIDVLERLRPAILERVPAIAEVDLRFDDRVIARPGDPLQMAASSRRGDPEGALEAAPPEDEAGSTPVETSMESAASTRYLIWRAQPKET